MYYVLRCYTSLKKSARKATYPPKHSASEVGVGPSGSVTARTFFAACISHGVDCVGKGDFGSISSELSSRRSLSPFASFGDMEESKGVLERYSGIMAILLYGQLLARRGNYANISRK